MSRIQVTDCFEIAPDNQCFKVIETYIGENEDGEEQEYEKETYHKTLYQSLKKIRREIQKESKTLQSLIQNTKRSLELDKKEALKVVEERDELNPYATLSEEGSTNA